MGVVYSIIVILLLFRIFYWELLRYGVILLPNNTYVDYNSDSNTLNSEGLDERISPAKRFLKEAN